MKLGFVSAILPDQSLDEVLAFARANHFQTVEIMCWPVGKAERRYAGVTHIDVTTLDAAGAAAIRAKFTAAGIGLSGLGYYPNPLTPDAAEAAVYIEHLKKVISAAALLGVNQVNTFIGRDPARCLADNWKVFDERWPAIVRHAEQTGVRIGIENCPMFFSQDEWPGGKNIATSPRNWRELFRRIPSPALGLNYDPSHLAWQMMDSISPLREFASRIFHVHAKDVQIDRAKLNDVGIMATPLEFHQPVLPGRGVVDWPLFFQTLSAIGYQGPVCIEVEDRAYEGSLESRHRALRESGAFLHPLLPK
ncbi:MAG: sugar phosphate isomerase/epimerase [Acidimicrobiia bacterium]|nr:sugar phosphate isomerase/epimerase [Acidimicrobiia bacterium]